MTPATLYRWDPPSSHVGFDLNLPLHPDLLLQEPWLCKQSSASTPLQSSRPLQIAGDGNFHHPLMQPFTFCQIYLPAISLQSSDLFACHLDKC